MLDQVGSPLGGRIETRMALGVHERFPREVHDRMTCRAGQMFKKASYVGRINWWDRLRRNRLSEHEKRRT
jgi:hypothetical protein